MEYHCITCIVERGKGDGVADEALRAGARGVTIYQARGKGVRERLQFLGHLIDPEKEVILIVTRQQQTQAIFDRVVKAARLEGAPDWFRPSHAESGQKRTVAPVSLRDFSRVPVRHPPCCRRHGRRTTDMLESTPRWVKVAAIAAAVVLPFGTLCLIAVTAFRRWPARPRHVDSALEEWWRLRDLARGSSEGARAS
jgi:hypothetical protein